jgi:hypothetical protein
MSDRIPAIFSRVKTHADTRSLKTHAFPARRTRARIGSLSLGTFTVRPATPENRGQADDRDSDWSATGPAVPCTHFGMFHSAEGILRTPNARLR